MTINMCIATVAWLSLTIGLIKKNERETHVPCMLAGIGLDYALVLYLQVTREAVQKAAGFEMPLLNQLHVLFSTFAVIFYIPVLYLGFKLLKDHMELLDIHRKVAIAAYAMRTLGFLFMFSLL